ncbi:41181_t:CDS:2, partial [Gigaspora margarita]
SEYVPKSASFRRIGNDKIKTIQDKKDEAIKKIQNKVNRIIIMQDKETNIEVDLSCTRIFQKTLFEYADFLETYSNFEIRNVISSWYQCTQDISKPSLEIATLIAIQNDDSSPFPSIPISWYYFSELRECEFKFMASNSRHCTKVYTYINSISVFNKKIQTIRIMDYNEVIQPYCREPLLKLISAQTELKELELTYYFTSNFTPFLRQKKRFAYYNHYYLRTIVRYLPDSLKILDLLNFDDYSHENLKFFLQDFDVVRVKLEVLILPFNIELDLLPNLKKFIEKAKYLRHIEIIRSENYNTEKQKDSEREIIELCRANCKKILDCFSVADAIKHITKEASRTLNFHPKVTVILPTNVSGKARADSANYVAKKLEVFDQLGITTQLIKISPQKYDETQIKELIKVQSNDSRNTGIMIQLPFPAGFSVNKSDILNTIPIHKDIDGLTIDSVGNLFDLNKGIKPATPLGICSIFDYYNIPTE